MSDTSGQPYCEGGMGASADSAPRDGTDAVTGAASGSITIALLGDVMLAGAVGRRIRDGEPLMSTAVQRILASADLVVANLECCITRSVARWPDPGKRFYFRAPPEAADVLAAAGVDVVSLANNHSLDFGPEGLADTIIALQDRGIETVGAGANLLRARSPAVVTAGGRTLAVLAVADHPADFAATQDQPGVAYVDLSHGLPQWLSRQVVQLSAEVDVLLVSAHWGPNFVPVPQPHIERASTDLVEAGASLVAGHSAHVIQPVEGRVIYDLGDFIDDYPPHPLYRHDLGAVWLARFDPDGTVGVRLIPTVCVNGFVDLATGASYDFTRERIGGLCADSSRVIDHGGLLEIRSGADASTGASPT